MMGHQRVEQVELFYEFSLDVPINYLLRSIDRFEQCHFALINNRVMVGGPRPKFGGGSPESGCRSAPGLACQEPLGSRAATLSTSKPGRLWLRRETLARPTGLCRDAPRGSLGQSFATFGGAAMCSACSRGTHDTGRSAARTSRTHGCTTKRCKGLS